MLVKIKAPGRSHLHPTGFDHAEVKLGILGFCEKFSVTSRVNRRELVP